MNSSYNTEGVARKGLYNGGEAEFINKAVGYKCEIRISVGEKEGNAKSLLFIIGLCIKPGDMVKFRAYDGPDAEEAVHELAAMLGF